jgi:hypothetical protein
MQAVRIPAFDSETLQKLDLRVAECDLFAPLGLDRHGSGDHIEATGLQPSDQRAEFADYAVNPFYPKAPEKSLRQFRRETRYFTVRSNIRGWRIVREAYPNRFLRFDPPQIPVRLCRIRKKNRGGDRNTKKFQCITGDSV